VDSLKHPEIERKSRVIYSMSTNLADRPDVLITALHHEIIRKRLMRGSWFVATNLKVSVSVPCHYGVRVLSSQLEETVWKALADSRNGVVILLGDWMALITIQRKRKQHIKGLWIGWTLGEMSTKFWLDNQKERDHLEGLWVDEWIILKCILGKQGLIGFVCLKEGNGGEVGGP
jgi:hypothetical protein